MLLKIKPEFESLIPPLSQEEFEQLESNILLEGIRDPLVIWQGVVIDGHNRYRIARKHDIEYRFIEKQFEDENEAKNWMIDNQLGRRNITKQQRDYLIGLRYKAEKKQGERVDLTSRQNEEKLTTAQKIGSQYGIGSSTVERAEKFADGLDNIGEVAPEIKKEILQGKSNFTNKDVMELSKVGPEVVVEKVVEKVEEKKQPKVLKNTGNNEWYTPKRFIDAAREVMGEIDLDPASCDFANNYIKAKTFYSEEDDGLEKEWHGKVWMNPPYSSNLIGRFCEKLTKSFLSGSVPEAIVLVNNATETGWFETLTQVAAAVAFPTGRVRFVSEEGEKNTPLQGQAFIYFGDRREDFVDVFEDFGWTAYVR